MNILKTDILWKH